MTSTKPTKRIPTPKDWRYVAAYAADAETVDMVTIEVGDYIVTMHASAALFLASQVTTAAVLLRDRASVKLQDEIKSSHADSRYRGKD